MFPYHYSCNKVYHIFVTCIYFAKTHAFIYHTLILSHTYFANKTYNIVSRGTYLNHVYTLHIYVIYFIRILFNIYVVYTYIYLIIVFII